MEQSHARACILELERDLTYTGDELRFGVADEVDDTVIETQSRNNFAGLRKDQFLNFCLHNFFFCVIWKSSRICW